MGEPDVLIERKGAVATLWLNRPEVHNAFDEVLVASVTQRLRVLDADSSVRVIVLAGRGKSFCAGADLGWMRRMASFSVAANRQDASHLAEMLRTLATLSKPTIARVHGAALAGGTGLVAACDIAVATPRASFGMTEVRLGLLPATISPYVIAAIGARAARRYFLSGERIDALEATRLGLVHVVVEEEALNSEIERFVDVLLLGAPGAQTQCKDLVRDFAHRPLTERLIDESSRRIATVRASAEAREGIAAFFEKRDPTWVH
jgi:methylglutaconyl-CoA hydratase